MVIENLLDIGIEIGIGIGIWIQIVTEMWIGFVWVCSMAHQIWMGIWMDSGIEIVMGKQDWVAFMSQSY